MNGLNQVRGAVIAALNGGGLTAVAAYEGKAKRYPGAVIAVDVAEAAGKAMTGRIITYDHAVYDLPVLLEWKLIYTGSVPCDEFSVTCLYSAEMAEALHRAVSFLAMDGTALLLRGIVDEYLISQSAAGRTVTITGRGLAARLLDNESRAVTYQAATLEEILRSHGLRRGQRHRFDDRRRCDGGGLSGDLYHHGRPRGRTVR